MSFHHTRIHSLRRIASTLVASLLIALFAAASPGQQTRVYAANSSNCDILEVRFDPPETIVVTAIDGKDRQIDFEGGQLGWKIGIRDTVAGVINSKIAQFRNVAEEVVVALIVGREVLVGRGDGMDSRATCKLILLAGVDRDCPFRWDSP